MSCLDMILHNDNELYGRSTRQLLSPLNESNQKRMDQGKSMIKGEGKEL
jgi:hypothetical protein